SVDREEGVGPGLTVKEEELGNTAGSSGEAVGDRTAVDDEPGIGTNIKGIGVAEGHARGAIAFVQDRIAAGLKIKHAELISGAHIFGISQVEPIAAEAQTGKEGGGRGVNECVGTRRQVCEVETSAQRAGGLGGVGEAISIAAQNE